MRFRGRVNDRQMDFQLGIVGRLFGEHLVNKRHPNRTFSDGGRYTFQVPATNVSDGEHTGQTSFEEVWRARERPLGFRQVFRREI
jgi:hypothetical protein